VSDHDEADLPKYDVAISFLSKDEPLAAALNDELVKGLDVFFFPRKQEELAGTDGLESMRQPFLIDSRVVVVLYRAPWGETPWTRVEQMAITDRFLREGWRWLFFLTLDTASKLPIWLSETHVRFNFAQYGIEQAIGAIKARVQECGGVITPVTALERARLVHQEQDFLALKEQMLNSHGGNEVLQKNVTCLFSEIARVCKEVTETGILVRCGYDQRQCTLTDNHVSLLITWAKPIINSIKDAKLAVTEFGGRLALPDERLMYVFDPPQKRRQRAFTPEISRAHEYCWRDPRGSKPLLETAAMADFCVQMFLESVARWDQTERPSLGR
jgi:hypothetical protein